MAERPLRRWDGNNEKQNNALKVEMRAGNRSKKEEFCLLCLEISMFVLYRDLMCGETDVASGRQVTAGEPRHSGPEA